MFLGDLRIKSSFLLVLYNTNWLVFTTEADCVFCAVLTGSVNWFMLLLQVLKYLHSDHNKQHLCSQQQDINCLKLTVTWPRDCWWSLWLSFHLNSYLSSSLFLLVFHQNYMCISHRPKSNNPLTFLTTLNEAPRHTTFSILLSLSPSLHLNTLFTSALKPTLQKPLSGTQAHQTFYTASCLLKQDFCIT